jgi:hypothetical protein
MASGIVSDETFDILSRIRQLSYVGVHRGRVMD